MKTVLKILMVEDLPSDAELVKREILKSGIHFNEKIVETKEEYIHALQDFKPDIILSDYSLPLFNGMQALLLREELAPLIPFILVTGSMNEETAVEVMKAGADDYVIKEHITRIGMAIKTVLEKGDIIRLKKKAEEKIKILSRAIEQNTASIIITDVHGNIEYVNPKFTRITGYSAEEVLGKNPRILKSGNTSPDEYKKLWETIISGGEWHGEFQNFKKNGDKYFESATISSITDENGFITHFLAVKEDITGRKAMEEKLVWEQYLMDSLLDNIPDFIYFKDLESRFLRINKSLAHDFGLNDPLMAIGKSDFDFFKSEHSQEAYHDEQEIISTGLPIIDKHEIETWFDRPPSWVSTTKMPLRDPNGTIIGTFGISRNITEKKKMLDDLILAKEKAEENDHLKTAFLQNISHEIRTPLNAIVGFSSILGNPDLPTHKRKEFINIINVSNDQLISIISGIIALATLESGQEQVTERETNINQLLENVQKQLLVDKISQEVTLSYHAALSDEMAHIYTDPIKLMQILVNLVGNALKFTHQGYVRYGYHLFNDTLQFFVEDSGIGIPKDMHQSIFERFRQVDNTPTRKYGGTGLGLALSKGYVELLGGRLSITSEPGTGSTFSFSLPYKKVEAVSGKIRDTMFYSPALFDGKTILVVEDEANNYVLIEELLSSMKLKVVKAENGLEAVNICAGQNSPDLVLMDIKMPVMDGMEATKKIRERNQDLPIIALTAYVFETEKERILASGCNACLEKPIRKHALYETLVKYLVPKD
jgi:PAS domain S-box-containing protein